AAALAVRGFTGVYFYAWPMLRAVVESARLVASHGRGACDELRASWPNRPIEYLALGDGRELSPDDGRRFRVAHGLPDTAVVFGVFGGLTAEKRVVPILRAFAASRPPNAYLLLAGWNDATLDVRALVASLGLTARVRILGDVDDATFDAAMA